MNAYSPPHCLTFAPVKLIFHDAATRVRQIFDCHSLPDELETAITSVYEEFDGDRNMLAVRSSATLEDQPDRSYAGQYTSYLNVASPESLRAAVKNCWASLWSERALSYRFQAGIENADIAMAVVIQRLVAADTAGVLFTANPVTGARDEFHINASHGLGEKVVSGTISPDDYVLDRNSLEIKSTRLGTNSERQEHEPSDNVRVTANESTPIDAAYLNAPQLKELGRQALAIERSFGGTPQDIEFAFSDGKLWILQSRPITQLPPEPLRDVRWEPPEPGAYLQRSQWVEHVPDPVCTLFEDLHMRRSLQKAWGSESRTPWQSRFRRHATTQ